MWLYWVLVRSSQSIILRWNVFDPCELFTTWHRTNFVEVRATGPELYLLYSGIIYRKIDCYYWASPSKIDEFQGQNAFLSKKTKTTRIRPVNVCAGVGWPKVREFFFSIFVADTLSWNHDPGPILDGGHPTNFGTCLLVCGQRIRWSLLENMF